MAKTNKRLNKDEAPRELERPAHKRRREITQALNVDYDDLEELDDDIYYDNFEKVTKKSYSPKARM